MELELILGILIFLPFETPDRKTEEPREGERLNINEKSGCDKKNEDVSGEVILAPPKNKQKKKTKTTTTTKTPQEQQPFTLKEFMGIFHNIEKTKDNKILEVDPNIQRSRTICQSIDGMQVSCC